jgi:predicted ATPase/Tfp pilus assembly protein PilF
MSKALAAHDTLARHSVESCRGTVVKMVGDGIYAVFDEALDALAAALGIQLALADSTVTSGISLRVRCGLHAGVVERREGDYFGNAVNRAARIMGVAHGGQVIVSQAVFDWVAGRLPAPVALRDLGAVRLKDLARPERVYQVLHPQLRQDFPALRSLEATPNNLPQQITSFVGREHALRDVRELLGTNRLLTLVGVGGLGKTRLSLQLGAEVLDDYADGVWFVEMAPLSDARLVHQAVASVLRVKEEPGRTVQEALLKFVRDRQLLVILDNCEHLIRACAGLANELLQSGPQVKVLASSRESLRVVGETTYALSTLSVPAPNGDLPVEMMTQYEAVNLFSDRARATQPTFRVNSNNAAAVADICHRLDGIPLAVELAAARVRALSVETIAERLTDRFRLLTGGGATSLPRQQTLRACIDWSYDLLTDAERVLLQRLAVFVGGWGLQGAEAVCTEGQIDKPSVLELLTRLVEKSLVEFEAESGRYRLLETVRQYARDRQVESGPDETVRDRHRDYYLALAEEAESKLKGAQQAEWLRRLDDEHENLRAALGWSLVEPGSGAGLRLCGALQRYWWTRGHLGEGRAWCMRALENVGADVRSPERAKALSAEGQLAYFQGDYAASRARHEESLAIRRKLGDQLGVGASLSSLGNVSYEQGDLSAARALYEECLAILRDVGSRSGVATSLNNLGFVLSELGDHAAASALHGESLAIKRELGDRSGIAHSLNNLGRVAYQQGKFGSAQTLYEESLAIRREIGDRIGIASSLNNLGTLSYDQGDFSSARTMHMEALAIWAELDDLQGIAYSLEGLAPLEAALGSYIRAARRWGAAERLRAEIGSPLSPQEQARYVKIVSSARANQVVDAAFDRAWQEGHSWTLAQAIAFALEPTDVRPES